MMSQLLSIQTRSSRLTSLSEYNKSALTDHVNQYNHVINWESTKPTIKTNDTNQRKIHEAIEIKKHPKTINRDEGGYKLPNVYNWLLTTTVTSSTGLSLIKKL